MISTLLIVIASMIGQTLIPDHQSEKSELHLFLLVGQSNMAGRGVIEDRDRTPHPRVICLNKDGQWIPAVAPLHFDKSVAGVGIGKTFGEAVADRKPKIKIGLIPCAVGGSPIDSWKPGEFYKPTRSHPWDDAIKRAKLAMKSGTLKAILWHQGESDSKPGLAESYEAKLHDLIKRFRKELKSPDVPFIAGQMGNFPDNPWSEFKKIVDSAHRRLSVKVKNTSFVGSDDLHHKGDKVHFDSASYRELGTRYAKAYFRFGETQQTRTSQGQN